MEDVKYYLLSLLDFVFYCMFSSFLINKDNKLSLVMYAFFFMAVGNELWRIGHAITTLNFHVTRVDPRCIQTVKWNILTYRYSSKTA